MGRSTLRFLAVVILALLGAPVAMHVVMHDLHHAHHDDDGDPFSVTTVTHSGHEHPIVSPAAPRTPSPGRAMNTSSTLLPATTAVPLLRELADRRNIIAFGGFRIELDTGPQSLLSTFLI